MSGHEGNGRLPELGVDDADDDTDDADDDGPLEADEASVGSAAAEAEADESLDERVEAVILELEGVDRVRDGQAVTYSVVGRPFAVLVEERLDVALDPAVGVAALRTPGTAVSRRGPGWVTFAPGAIDRFALDRAEAWIRLAHRRASG